MKNSTKLLLSVFLFSILISFCKKKEETPTISTVTNDCPDCKITPSINFAGIQVNSVINYFGYKHDSITISLQYKDLDGNLGYIVTNQYHTNYFCEVYFKIDGTFKQIQVNDSVNADFLNKNSIFPPLPTTDRGSGFNSTGTAKMGTLSFGTKNFWMNYYLRDSASVKLKFRIYIEDNDGNKSNTIETSEVVVHNYELII